MSASSLDEAKRFSVHIVREGGEQRKWFGMGLSLDDHIGMLSGFQASGFRMLAVRSGATNPVQVVISDGGTDRKFRLWAYDITHGGGGPTVRAANEFRIQITNGPASLAEFDQNGFVDLLIGYSKDRKAIVAYDRRWLEKWSEKNERYRIWRLTVHSS